MQIGAILLCLAFPLLEIAVLIKVGQWIGFWWTVLLLVASAVTGGLIVQQQGFNTLHRSLEAAREGRPPIEPMVDSVFLLLAGVLFMVPGLITDAAGFLLLVPALRRHVARWLIGRMLASGTVHMQTTHYEERPAPDAGQRRPGTRPRGEGVVIEGEWERIDEPPHKGKRPPDGER